MVPVLSILIGAVCYNGVLALLNAHLMSVGRNDVVIAEMLLLCGAALVVAISGPRLGDGAPAAFVALRGLVSCRCAGRTFTFPRSCRSSVAGLRSSCSSALTTTVRE